MKRLKINESVLRRIVNKLLRESNITSIFSARGSQVEPRLIEIRGVANNNYGTIVINDQAYNQSVITNKLALIYKK
jgi:hypothetical protein